MATRPVIDPWAAHEFKPLDMRAHLLDRFVESPLLAFPPANVPPVTGICGLYIGTSLVYIGKAADKSDLRSRLWTDAWKISARKYIKLAQMQCRFLLISKEWVHYTERPAHNEAETSPHMRPDRNAWIRSLNLPA